MDMTQGQYTMALQAVPHIGGILPPKNLSIIAAVAKRSLKLAREAFAQ